MQETYETAFDWVKAIEGGWSNHPRDPGGATMKGVTQRTYDGYRDAHGLVRQTVRSISDAEVEAIYRLQYWVPVWGDRLPAGLDYAMFDYAINSGPARAVKEIQRILGVTADGIMGVQTMSAIQSRSPAALVVALCEARMDFLEGLAHWPTFKKGWTRRVMGEEPGHQLTDTGVIDRGYKLAIGAKPAEILAPRPTATALDAANAKAPATERSLTASIKDMMKDPKAATGVMGGALSTFMTAAMEPPFAYFAGAALILVVGAVIFTVLREARLADG